MKRLGLALAVLLAGCAKPLALGDACAEATACGNGADCYHGVCTPLCADDAECEGELVCARHRCLLATGEPKRKATDRAPHADSRLPTADSPGPNAYGRQPTADSGAPNAASRLPTADSRAPHADDRPRRPGLRSSASSEVLDPVALMSELRAIRAELEGLRREQERLNQAITDLKSQR